MKSRQAEILGFLDRTKVLANELCPINTLPPEVLSVIPTYWPADSQRDLIRATHVCRYWRTTLIASPSLWNVVKSGNEALARCILHRSRQFPLSLEIKHPGQEGVFSDVVLSRAKSLTIDLPVTSLKKTLARLVSPTPALEELSITLTDSSVDSFSIADTGGFVDSFSIADTGGFVMLSKLHLKGVHSNLFHLLIPRLATLHLENLRNSPRMPDLLRFLRHTPWLERLVLVKVGPRKDEGFLGPVVSLGLLRTLTLHGTVAKANLLRHLVIPASANINLMGHFEYGLEGFMEELLPPSLQHLPVTSSFTSLSIKKLLLYSCVIKLSGNDGSLNTTVTESVKLERFPGRVNLTSSTAGLCFQRLTPLVLNTVTHLAIQSDPQDEHIFPDPSLFHDFLHQLPSLQSICLVHCDFNSIRAFDPVEVNLPSFSSLDIHVAPDRKIDLGLLSDIAKSKLSLQCPLERVKLVSSTAIAFDKSEMVRLREHVQVVEVREVNEN